jgi:O-antigen ligase
MPFDRNLVRIMHNSLALWFSRYLGEARGFAVAISFALLWVVLQTTAVDRLNIYLLFAAVLLIAVSVRWDSVLRGRRPKLVLLSLGSLSLISFSSTLAAGGGFDHLRLTVLVSVIVLLGIAVSSAAGSKWVLSGLLLGSALVLCFELIVDTSAVANARFLFSGTWGSLDGLEYNNWLSIVAGLVSYFSLFGNRLWLLLWFSPFAGIYFAAAVNLGQIGPSVAVLAVAAATIALLLLKFVDHRLVDRIVAPSVGLVALAGALVLAVRPLANRVAVILGDTGDLEARYVIWESAVGEVDGRGFFLGYGTYFWSQETSFVAAVREGIAKTGGDQPDQLHSMYVDAFLAFGAIGVAILLMLLGLALYRAFRGWRGSGSWTSSVFPLLFFIGFGTLGITESYLTQQPIGWFLTGIFVGLVILPAAFPKTSSSGDVGFAALSRTDIHGEGQISNPSPNS